MAVTEIERGNRTVRQDRRAQYSIETIAEARDVATEWPWTDNTERPSIGSGGITPAQDN